MGRAPGLLAAASLAALQGCAAHVQRSAYGGDAAHVASYLREGPGRAAERFTDRIDDVDCLDCTLLHFAARGGSIEVARVLLAGGADPNAVDRDGQTALHWACAMQQVEMVRFLLAHGARPSLAVRSARGQTPLLVSVSIMGTRTDVVPTGLGMVANTRPALPSAELARLLLDAGADLSGLSPNGNTPLHIAASRGDAEMVRLLLSRGADPNRVNAGGVTPVELAERFKQAETARILRQAGAR